MSREKPVSREKSPKIVRKRPTLGDVAKAAGVSSATVSRVLNTPQLVGLEARRKIEEQIRLLGYVRDGAARALASSNTRVVGAIIPTLENAIFAAGINALEARLDEAGYTLLLAVSKYDLEHEYSEIREIMEHGVDGLVLIGHEHLPESFTLLEQHDQLFINIWSYSEDSVYPCVGIDNRSAAYDLASYLISLGHKRIGMMAGFTAGNDRAAHRLEGFQMAMRDHQLVIDPDDVIERKYDIAQGRSGAAYFLDRPEIERPSAILCGNDVLAVGCMLECQARGLKVPDDMSITGFDNLTLAQHLPPGITTVDIPSSELGRLAAEFILDSIKGKEPSMRTRIETSLIIRGSTGSPRLTHTK